MSDELERIRRPYDQLAKVRDDQIAVAKVAIETGCAFAGTWLPTDTKLFLVTEEYLTRDQI